MNHDHVTESSRSLAGTRRSLVGGALAAVTGWLAQRASDARKKRKHKKRKPTCGKVGRTPVKGKCCPGAVTVDGTNGNVWRDAREL